MESISIFDIIKIGIGPSSSHTMGPWKAALEFIAYLHKNNVIGKLTRITCYLYGSLAKTGIGHGTDVAVIMGLAGYDYLTINTDLIPQIIDEIKQTAQIVITDTTTIPFIYHRDFVFDYQKETPVHPNEMKLEAQFSDNSVIAVTYYSVGGGFIDSDLKTSASIEKIITPYPCHVAADIAANCKRLNLKISELVLLNETAWRNPNQTKAHALYIWNEIKECIFRGINKSGLLPGGLHVRRRAYDLSRKMLQGEKFENVNEFISTIQSGSKDFVTVNKWISIFAMAVNEENASFGRIITAPTNGASGVIPAVLMYAHCFIPHFDDEEIIQFIVTAGEIGTLYKKGATISGALGGCQAEIGVSSSMAAAGLTEAMGGTKDQVLQAAEIAMEHHLGMTCDPIGGLVQIPCIERNSMGAIKAVTACNIAMESDSDMARISLDDVIKTMWNTALDMNYKYKETSEGGLAKIPVSNPEC